MQRYNISFSQLTDATVVKCQFDWDDGRAQYEVEIRNGWTEYEFEIDAVTGTIFSRDIDNDRW